MSRCHFELLTGNKYTQQDCIPVGCVPPALWLYLLACSAGGGCLFLGGGVCSLGVSAPGGVCSCKVSAPGGVCSWRGVSAPGGGVSQHALRQIPPCEQNHTRLWKHNLAPTSLRAVITGYSVCTQLLIVGLSFGSVSRILFISSLVWFFRIPITFSRFLWMNDK